MHFPPLGPQNEVRILCSFGFNKTKAVFVAPNMPAAPQEEFSTNSGFPMDFAVSQYLRASLLDHAY